MTIVSGLVVAKSLVEMLAEISVFGTILYVLEKYAPLADIMPVAMICAISDATEISPVEVSGFRTLAPNITRYPAPTGTDAMLVWFVWGQSCLVLCLQV